MSIAYYNGDFCDFSEIKIPLTDRALFFGDGVYDAAIGANGKIYLEDEHLKRLFSNAEKMDIKPNLNSSALSQLIREVVQKNQFEQYFIYIQLSRFSEQREHAYKDTEKSNLLITVKEHRFPDSKKELKLISTPDIRYQMCDVKTLNLLPAVLASKYASKCGCDEAVFVRDGVITECAHSNVHIIKDGTLYTHPENRHILPGITRKRLLYFCSTMGIPYKEIPFALRDLYEADDVLVTSTTKLCQRCSEIDGKMLKKNCSNDANRLIFALREDFSEKVC